MVGLGPKLPLNRNSEHGTYQLTISYAEQIKQNFKNLLLTSPGERIMNPDFGVGLRRFLFEPKEAAIPKIRQRIFEQTKQYLPFIKINLLSFDPGQSEVSALDSQILSIEIEYSVSNLNLNSSIVLSSDGINKV